MRVQGDYTMNKLNRFTSAAARLLEVIHWLLAVGAVAAFILSFTSQDFISHMMEGMKQDASLYGFEIHVLTAEGAVSFTAFRFLSAAGLFLSSLMGMIFRNIHLIFKTSAGKTWFAKGETPFQKDTVRMVREIGIFSISIPVTGLILSVIARLMMGVDAVEIRVDLSGLIMGIVVLCLSQIFAYGMRLQQDVDGLL